MVDLGHREGIGEVLLVDSRAHQLVEMGVALVERLGVPAVVVDATIVALASLGPEDERLYFLGTYSGPSDRSKELAEIP